MSGSDKVILEERILPERSRLLGGKRYITKANGLVLRESFVCFCDSCGFRLDQEKPVIICQVCRRKLCSSPSCAILYSGRHYCPQDLQQILPLKRLQFKIIHGLINELSLGSIKDLTHSKREEFTVVVDELKLRGYVERKGFSLFSYYQLLELGILAWRTYYRSFSADDDVSYFIEEVTKKVQESGDHADKRNDGASR